MEVVNADFELAVATKLVGDEIKFVYYRNGERKELSTIVEFPKRWCPMVHDHCLGFIVAVFVKPLVYRISRWQCSACADALCCVHDTHPFVPSFHLSAQINKNPTLSYVMVAGLVFCTADVFPLFVGTYLCAITTYL
jgi:hypothetical protein